MTSSALQPAGVRLFIAANALFWSLPLQVNLALTLLAALWVPAPARSPPKLAWLLFGGLLGYGLLAFAIGPCGDGGMKVIASAAILALLFAALRRLASAVRPDRPLLSTEQAVTMLTLIAATAVIEYIYKLMTSVPIGMLRVGGLYLEPSHLALSAAPLIFLLLMRGSLAQRTFAVVVAGMLVAVAYSTTLLALLVALPLIAYMGAVIQRRINPAALLGLLMIAAAPLALPLLAGSEDTLARLYDLTDLREDANISSLVYANGWQLLDSNLESSGGLGLGLNAMGCNPRAYTDITGWLELIDLGDQNFNDGSFILSKLGSELGVVGLLLFAVVAAWSVRLMWRAGRSATPSGAVIASAWLAIIGLGGLIRSGGGYFAGPVLLAVFAVLVLRTQSARTHPVDPVASEAPP